LRTAIPSDESRTDAAGPHLRICSRSSQHTQEKCSPTAVRGQAGRCAQCGRSLRCIAGRPPGAPSSSPGSGQARAIRADAGRPPGAPGVPSRATTHTTPPLSLSAHASAPRARPIAAEPAPTPLLPGASATTPAAACAACACGPGAAPEHESCPGPGEGPIHAEPGAGAIHAGPGACWCSAAWPMHEPFAAGARGHAPAPAPTSPVAAPAGHCPALATPPPGAAAGASVGLAGSAPAAAGAAAAAPGEAASLRPAVGAGRRENESPASA